MRKASKRFLSSAESESPPEKTPLRQDRSSFSSPSILRSASNNVGTPAMKLGLYLDKSCAYVFGVNCGTRIHSPPFTSMECMLTPRPKPWNMGIIASILSPGANIGFVATIWAPKALKLRFERSIPLVTPVVPPL